MFGSESSFDVLQVDLHKSDEIMVALGFIKDNSDRIDLFKLWDSLCQS